MWDLAGDVVMQTLPLCVCVVLVLMSLLMCVGVVDVCADACLYFGVCVCLYMFGVCVDVCADVC